MPDWEWVTQSHWGSHLTLLMSGLSYCLRLRNKIYFQKPIHKWCKATLIIFFGPRFLQRAENVPNEKKNLTFVFFFPPTCPKVYSKIGSILVKKMGKICKKMSDKKPPTWLKNPWRDSWTKEYNECCLSTGRPKNTSINDLSFCFYFSINILLSKIQQS